jgi:hypothetical protein
MSAIYDRQADEIAAYVQQSTYRSAVPVKVEDKQTLITVAHKLQGHTIHSMSISDELNRNLRPSA